MNSIDAIPELLKKQRDFFASGKTRSYEYRRTQLEKLKRSIIENEDQILRALHQDLRKPKQEALTVEVATCIDEINQTLKNLKAWMSPEKVPTPLPLWPSKSFIFREPLGLTLIIAPWNYPFQLLVMPLIGALAAGNCAVLKPSELTPHTSKVITDLFAKNFAAELVKVFEGGVPETQALLAEKFDHIFFTGGLKVGQIVMEAAAKNVTPVTLELGGKSPCLVEQSADLKVTAQRIVWAKYLNAGQTCVAPDYLLVHESLRDELVSEMQSVIIDFFGESPKLSPDYARIVNEHHHIRLSKLLEGVEILAGGESDKEEKYLAPTIVNEPPSDHPLMREEIFGPILPVLSFKTLDEAILRIHENPKPLALYVFTADSQVEDRILSEVQFGGGCVNDCITHVGSSHLPFGGVGPSGTGAYHGRAGFELFSHRKSVLKRSTKVNPALIYPPYSEMKVNLIRKALMGWF